MNSFRLLAREVVAKCRNCKDQEELYSFLNKFLDVKNVEERGSEFIRIYKITYNYIGSKKKNNVIFHNLRPMTKDQLEYTNLFRIVYEHLKFYDKVEIEKLWYNMI